MSGWRSSARPQAARRASLGLLLLALPLAALATLDPSLPREIRPRTILVVVDITRSMNVRDMTRDGVAVSRLDAAKAILPEVLARLPPGSRVGLGLFTERRVLTLIEPVEIHANYAPLTGAIAGLDWRMAWEGDSLIARGLHSALDRAAALDADLIFVTDGQEAPPPPFSGPPSYRGVVGEVGGFILGAGGPTPAPIPRFDREGREIGFYRTEDVQQGAARIGAPPPDAASRPGFHPRNNPYGESDLAGEEHLSALRADYLRARAEEVGLGYATLADGPAAVFAAIETSTRFEPVRAPVSIAAMPAALALASLALAYVVAALGRRR
jgi:mxaL protein